MAAPVPPCGDEPRAVAHKLELVASQDIDISRRDETRGEGSRGERIEMEPPFFVVGSRDVAYVPSRRHETSTGDPGRKFPAEERISVGALHQRHDGIRHPFERFVRRRRRACTKEIDVLDEQPATRAYGADEMCKRSFTLRHVTQNVARVDDVVHAVQRALGDVMGPPKWRSGDLPRATCLRCTPSIPIGKDSKSERAPRAADHRHHRGITHYEHGCPELGEASGAFVRRSFWDTTAVRPSP